MEVADAEAEALAASEPAAWCVHADCGRCEGVVGREDEGAPVLAAFVGRLGRPGEDVVPFENVGFGGVGGDEGDGFGGEDLVFSRESLVRCFCGHGEVL